MVSWKELKMMNYKKVEHTLEPVYDKKSRVLLLGSMPSVKSREIGFYYGHPKNNFWKVLSRVYEEEMPLSTQERIEFVLRHKIALFDVIKSCDISGSSDGSIKNVIPNDLEIILETTKIEKIYTLGRKAKNLYDKYIYTTTKVEAIYLPSTSPANCKKGIIDVLVKEFKQIREITDNLR